MQTARQYFESGTNWTSSTARQALPILLALAKEQRKCTYQELDREIIRRNRLPYKDHKRNMGDVLSRIGDMLNMLSTEWQSELPPLTVLITGGQSGKPSDGVDRFLERFASRGGLGPLKGNRSSIIKNATQAVYSCSRWDQVAHYFDLEIPADNIRVQPITLPMPNVPESQVKESLEHEQLKCYVAAHPELFTDYGSFGPGKTEVQLRSLDRLDVLFGDDQRLLAIEVKAKNVDARELTRGIFQCVKYAALLRAEEALENKNRDVHVVLVTSRTLPRDHLRAIERLDIPWIRIEVRPPPPTGD